MDDHRPISVLLAGAAAVVALALPLTPPLSAQSLKGSPTSVERAHERASARGLYFYKTASGVRGAADRGRFVRLTGNADYQTYRVSHPYTTGTTRTFVERLAAQYRAGCGEKLIVTSAARPLSRQLPNASPLSLHPTGTAVDFRKPRGKCLTWLRRTLLDLEAKGIIDATEEYSPPHFHVSVFNLAYDRYLAARGVRTQVATSAPAAAVTRVAREAPASASPTRGTAGASPRRYTIRRGDSLWSIARQFDTTVTALRHLNPGKGSRILAGQQLFVPAR